MNRREAEELLPWFIAGTLSAAESRAVQAFIDSGEISQAELDELSVLTEAVSEEASTEPEYDPAILERAMAKLDSIPQDEPVAPVVVAEPTQSDAPGVWRQLLDRLQWSMSPPLAKVAIAGQFALVIGLVVALNSNTTGENVSEVVSQERTADLTIGFAPGTTEADLRNVLLEHDATLIGGPGALGLYDIDLANDESADAVLASLKANPLIIYAEPVNQ